MIQEGISYDKSSQQFLFNWESDSPSDIIKLVDIRRKASIKGGVQYYVPYVALPRDGKYTLEYKSIMNLFRDKLKRLELNPTDIDRMIDSAIAGLIDVYGDRLNNIELIVTPKSSSTLNQKIAARIHELIPNAKLVSDVFIKNSIDKITINMEKIAGLLGGDFCFLPRFHRFCV